MGLYISDNDVKVRLKGKVKFTEDENDENHMHVTLLRRLINEAEGDVEQDLSPRFAAPFQTVDNKPFKSLPERPTREYLKTMCELKAVMRVLETDFGAGSVANAEKYTKLLEKRYDTMKSKIIERWEDNAKANTMRKGWIYPPLPDLKLAYFNMEADDGFAGMVLVTNKSVGGDFPQGQINEPSEAFFSAELEKLD